jgi:hypothetical protein
VRKIVAVLSAVCSVLVVISAMVCLCMQALPGINRYATLSVSRIVYQIEWIVVGPVFFALICCGFFWEQGSDDPNSDRNRMRLAQPDRWIAIGVMRGACAALAFVLFSSQLCRIAVPYAGGRVETVDGEVRSIKTNAETFGKSHWLFPCAEYVHVLIQASEERLCYRRKDNNTSPLASGSLEPGQRVVLRTRVNSLGVYVEAISPSV